MKRKTHKSKTPRNPGASLDNVPRFRATIETMKTPGFLDAVKTADVILTFPASPEWNPQIAYGKQTLQIIASGESTMVLGTLALVIDWTTDEPDYLAALLREIKGGCDLFQ